MEILGTVIAILNNTAVVPVWFLTASALLGVIVGTATLLIAVVLLRKPERATREARKESKEVVAVAGTSAPELPPVKAAPDKVTSSKATVTQPYKPVPPIRQHYWYYVTGASGRFATLREALSVLGIKLPTDKMPEWSKLSKDVKDRIKRSKLGDKQPVTVTTATAKIEGAQAAPRQELQQEAPPVVAKPRKVEPAPDTIVKPLGNGAFVTIKKKPK